MSKYKWQHKNDGIKMTEEKMTTKKMKAKKWSKKISRKKIDGTQKSIPSEKKQYPHWYFSWQLSEYENKIYRNLYQNHQKNTKTNWKCEALNKNLSINIVNNNIPSPNVPSKNPESQNKIFSTGMFHFWAFVLSVDSNIGRRNVFSFYTQKKQQRYGRSKKWKTKKENKEYPSKTKYWKPKNSLNLNFSKFKILF